MDLLFAAASGTYDAPQPLSSGLSMMAKYSSSHGSLALSASEPKVPQNQNEPVCDVPRAEKKSPPSPVEGNSLKVLLSATLAPQQPEDAAIQSPPVADAQTTSPALEDSSPQARSAEDVVGIRAPRNDHRRAIAAPSSSMAREKCTSVYRQLCALYDVHTNSRVVEILQQHEDNTQNPLNPFDDLTSLDLRLCMLRDKGLLPIVELLRLCVNLRSLSLASNDITNCGIEYLAHAIVEGTVDSSFEVIEETTSEREEQVKKRISNTGAEMTSMSTRFGVHIASLDVSDNTISLGGMRLIQLIAEKLPSLVDVNVSGARVDSCELDELETILAENRSCCGG